MITVCPGWETRHRVPVLLDDDGTHNGEISHGLCANCLAAVTATLDAEERATAAAKDEEVRQRVNRYAR